jgi:hypothetical protein
MRPARAAADSWPNPGAASALLSGVIPVHDIGGHTDAISHPDTVLPGPDPNLGRVYVEAGLAGLVGTRGDVREAAVRAAPERAATCRS